MDEDRSVVEKADGWMDGWMDGRMDGMGLDAKPLRTH